MALRAASAFSAVVVAVHARQAGARSLVESHAELHLRHGIDDGLVNILHRLDEVRLAQNQVPAFGNLERHSFSSINAILLPRAARRATNPPFIIEVVPPLTFTQARETVLSTVRAARPAPATEEIALEAAAGRVLAEDVAADRDTPARGALGARRLRGARRRPAGRAGGHRRGARGPSGSRARSARPGGRDHDRRARFPRAPTRW